MKTQQNPDENKEIRRPVTVRIKHLKMDLQKAISGSELPPFLLEMILKEIFVEISLVAQKEYDLDLAEWETMGKEAGNGRHQ